MPVEGEGQFPHKYKSASDVYLCRCLDWRSRIGLQFCLQKLPRNHRLLLNTFIHTVPRHSDVEVIGFLWRRQLLALLSSIMYRRMGNEEVSEKPEKEKAEKTSWENKITWMKTEERRGSQTLGLGNSILLFWMKKRSYGSCSGPLLLLLFSGNE